MASLRHACSGWRVGGRSGPSLVTRLLGGMACREGSSWARLGGCSEYRPAVLMEQGPGAALPVTHTNELDKGDEDDEEEEEKEGERGVLDEVA